MTDPKPAPPATDDCICEDVRVLGACPVHEPRSTEPANDNLVAAWLADLQGMDDADREHDVTVLDTRSLLLRIAADAETIKAERARADKYEAESEQKGADLMAAEAVIESLKADAAQWDAIIKDNDATRTIRDLRETIRKQAEEIERLKGDLQEAKHFSSMLTAALENRNEELKDLANRLKHRCFRYHIEDGVQLAKELAQVETLRAALAGVLPGIDEAWALWPEGRNAVLKARAAIAATEPKQ